MLLINENASEFLPGELKGQLKNTKGEEIIVWMPEADALPKEDLEGITGLFQLSGYHRTICEYDNRIAMFCTTDRENTVFSRAVNPVIIYCTGSVRLPGEVFGSYRGIMYGLNESEWMKLEQGVQISENGYHVSFSEAGEVYQYQTNFIRRMIQFLSSLSILVIILNLAITTTICNMEFRVAGVEYAIKKAIGYSFMQRNKSQLIKINAGSWAAMIVLTCTGYMTGIFDAGLCAGIGIMLIFVENVVMAVYIMRYEMISVTKMLKGGCL